MIRIESCNPAKSNLMKYLTTNNTQFREATPSHIINLQGAVATALCRRAADGTTSMRLDTATTKTNMTGSSPRAGACCSSLDLWWEYSLSPLLRRSKGSQMQSVTPTLGDYPNTSLPLGTDTTVTPDAAPTNAASMNVSTSTNFKGKLEGNPATGLVRVTDAHPAGTYTVTVKAFDTGGLNATKTFMLTVTTPVTCNPLTFVPVAPVAAGTGPGSAAVGDFNGDGKQDLVVTNFSSNTASIILGDGAGHFGAATSFTTGAALIPTR